MAGPAVLAEQSGPLKFVGALRSRHAPSEDKRCFPQRLAVFRTRAPAFFFAAAPCASTKLKKCSTLSDSLLAVAPLFEAQKMDDEDIPLVCVPVRGPGSRPPPPAILAPRTNTVTPDADDDVALICVPKKVGKKKRSKPAAAPPPAAPTAPEATKPLPAPAAPAVAKPAAKKKPRAPRTPPANHADALAATAVARATLPPDAQKAFKLPADVRKALAATDGFRWPAPLQQLDGHCWGKVLVFVLGDFEAMCRLERTCKRGAALAAVLAQDAKCPLRWRISTNPKVPKRARDTLWRISRPSERLASYLLKKKCCVCRKDWTGAVDEPFGVFAHPDCIKAQVVNDRFIDEPKRETYGTLSAPMKDDLVAAKLTADQHKFLPRGLFPTFSFGYGGGASDYAAVWMNYAWVVPRSYTIQGALYAAKNDQTAMFADEARKVAERISRAKASYEAAAARALERDRVARVAIADAACPPSYEAFRLTLDRTGLGDAAALVGRDFFDAVAKTEVSATTAKFRLSLVQALVADDDLVRDAGAARKGATFVERVLGAVAANKPRGGKPTPDYVAYVKGYLRSGGGAAPKPKPAKKKEPRADEDGCTCTYRSW